MTGVIWRLSRVRCGSLMWLAAWLLAENSVGLSIGAPTHPLNVMRFSEGLMAPGFPYSKCPKITKRKLHGLLWTCLKSYTDCVLAGYTDCFADSTDYKWVTMVSLDSGGKAIEPTWEECQQICEHIFKLSQFIIALIIQWDPKYIWPKAIESMLL